MLNKELIEEYHVNETSITIMYNYIYKLCTVNLEIFVVKIFS